jgi:chemotaxis protein MotB
VAKKHKHPEHENLERWLVSYADFMTLLFATFTALYALSLSDVGKLKDVTEAISQGFEEQSLLNGIKSILEGKSPPSKNPDTIPMDSGQGNGLLDKFKSMTYTPGEIESTAQLIDDLNHDAEAINGAIQTPGSGISQFDGAGGQGMEDASAPIRPVETSVQERGIRVSFDSRMLFPAGAATVRPEAYKFLDTVAQRLKKFQGTHIIHIEGHTDAQPISSVAFPSNWELSGARASSIVRYFIDRQRFNPGSLVSVGYGSTQPVATNQTSEGRAKNRRVDIIIYNEKMSALINPRLQAFNELPVTQKSSKPGDKPVIHALPVVPDKPMGTTDGPVRVIIKDKDGTEKVLIPKTKPKTEEPLTQESSGEKSVGTTSSTHTTPTEAVKVAAPSHSVPTHPSTEATKTEHKTSSH